MPEFDHRKPDLPDSRPDQGSRSPGKPGLRTRFRAGQAGVSPRTRHRIRRLFGSTARALDRPVG